MIYLKKKARHAQVDFGEQNKETFLSKCDEMRNRKVDSFDFTTANKIFRNLGLVWI